MSIVVAKYLFPSKMDDPNFGVTVHDPTTGQDVVLSEKDVATIKRLRGGKVPNGEYNLHEDWVDFYRCATSIFFNLLFRETQIPKSKV